MTENPLNPLTLEERVKYIERASLSFFFFVVSFLSLIYSESIPSLYGYGIIIFVVIFMVSFPFTGWYFGQLGVSVLLDATHRSITLINNNTKLLSPVAAFLAISIGVITLKQLDQSWQNIMVGAVWLIASVALPKYKRILNWVQDKISKINT